MNGSSICRLPINDYCGANGRSHRTLECGLARPLSAPGRDPAHQGGVTTPHSISKSLVVLLFGLFALPVATAQSFEFAVRHDHLLKDCRGTLKISDSGVEYQTPHSKDGRKWKFQEIQTIEVKSPTQISLITYEDQKRYFGKDRAFEFELLSEKVKPELSAFLLAHVTRPMIVAVLPETAKPAFEFPVKHLHAITGATGTLRFYPDRVVFQSAREGDSRLWRLSDIERFSQPDRYRFQIVTHVPKAGWPTEIYNFQLMEDLPPAVYDYLWVRLHPSSYYPEVRTDVSSPKPMGTGSQPQDFLR